MCKLNKTHISNSHAAHAILISCHLHPATIKLKNWLDNRPELIHRDEPDNMSVKLSLRSVLDNLLLGSRQQEHILDVTTIPP